MARRWSRDFTVAFANSIATTLERDGVVQDDVLIRLFLGVLLTRLGRARV